MHGSSAPQRTPEQPECSSNNPRLTREQVVDRIITINRGATADFLSRFAESSLERYLDRLVAASGPRGDRFSRAGDTPAILWRESTL